MLSRSDDVEWTVLGSAMTDAVAATMFDEAAQAIVRGWHDGLGARSVAVWLTGASGELPRLVAGHGEALASPEPPAADGGFGVRAHFDCSDDGVPICDVTVTPKSSDEEEVVLVRGVFDRHDHLGSARRGAIELLCSVAGGARSRSRSSETDRRIGLLLQHHLLPKLEPVRTGHAAVRYVPAGGRAEVGGDWYDIVQTRDGRTVLVLGDVVGHSVEAAVQMSELRSALHSHLLEGLPAGLALARLNDLVIDRGGFATCCCVEIGPNGVVTHSAGHPPPILATVNGHAATCAVRPGPPLGSIVNASYPGRRCELGDGDAIVLYSDGLVEARGIDITDGIERVRRAAANVDIEDLERLASHLLGLVEPHDQLRDDVAVLVFRPEHDVLIDLVGAPTSDLARLRPVHGHRDEGEDQDDGGPSRGEVLAVRLALEEAGHGGEQLARQPRRDGGYEGDDR